MVVLGSFPACFRGEEDSSAVISVFFSLVVRMLRPRSTCLNSELLPPLCLQDLRLLQGNPATDRSRDAKESGEGEACFRIKVDPQIKTPQLACHQSHTRTHIHTRTRLFCHHAFVLAPEGVRAATAHFLPSLLSTVFHF